MDDREKKAEYARGYNAGRKRTEAEMAQGKSQWAEQTKEARELWRVAYAAALQGLIVKSGWQMDGKTITTMDEYIQLAKRFADATPGSRRPL